ncbi:glycoside hydrolase [Paenibacillus swuensis]|uniref:Glycoside hydrolase n=1 Tax=Paenibacillus swuensis TaxID=1178515 RepID=A0A172THH1_9BACL|nr:glycoside hydrolase family 16 protein [Paenibacillus swuensis]ANE46460.1 glycoside hydrolase [Paenibacillus swuensis]
MRTTAFARNPLEKPGYTLVFQDDFETSMLDRTKWLPYYLPQWSSRQNSAANYRFEESQLLLRITEEQMPWSPEFNGDVKVSNLQTGVFAGPLDSTIGQHRFSSECLVREEQPEERLFVPQYGYFEIRAKGLGTPHNVCAFWMIGFEDAPTRSAEICPFELKGWNVKDGSCTLGFGIHAFGDPAIEEEFFEKEFAMDPTLYHVYAVDWTPEGVDFYIDNELVHRSRQSPDYPMQLMLNIYEVPAAESGKAEQPVYPSEFAIDYVRCYQRAVD